MIQKRSTWLQLSLINLFVLATLGTLLRSKILFPLGFINYSNLLQAHSHFAFGGWVTVVLFTLLTYDLLPPEKSTTPKYTWLLIATNVSSWAMALLFPPMGYNWVTIIFSTLFIFSTYAFTAVFLKDLRHTQQSSSVKLLCRVALWSLVISSVGPYSLAYIMATKDFNIVLFKDSIYTFLHFQYNGFFTLAVFALLFSRMQTETTPIRRFSVCLALSVLPTLFFSFLWHPSVIFRIVAIIGCIFLALVVYYFFAFMHRGRRFIQIQPGFIQVLWFIALGAFLLKTILQAGTIYKPLGTLVFGSRPVIIGFLHLVFLGFVTVFLLGYIYRYAARCTPWLKFGIISFTIGVALQEVLLGTQGLMTLFKSNDQHFPLLLWLAAILLMLSALVIALSYKRYDKEKREAH